MTHIHPRRQGRTPRPAIRWIVFFCAALCVLGASRSSSRASAAPDRVTLPGQRVPDEVATASLQERLPAAQTLRLTFVLPLRNQAELEQLDKSLYDRTSPLYRHFLKPGEFTARFGPTQSEVDDVSRYAAANGLTVQDVTPSRVLVHVTSPVSAAETAFGVHLNTYLGSDGRAFYAPDAAPSFTPDIAGRIVGVLGLDTAQTPRHSPLHAVTPEQIQAKQLLSGANAFYSNNSAGLTPADIHKVYGIPSGAGYDGSGQTLALFEHATYTPSDIPNYQNAFGLPATPVTPIAVDNFNTSAPTTYGDGSDEVTLDIDMMLALAPNASSILVYEGANTADIYDKIANDDLASVVSTSWYNSSNDTGGGTLETMENTAFVQMQTQGQSMFSSSGDGGAYPDQDYLGPDPTLSMQDPGGQPNLTSVGGTYLNDASNETYVSETSWADTNDHRLHTNSMGDYDGYGTGGGGGIDGDWGFPSYQNGAFSSASNPQGSFSKRNVPDVSLFGDYDEAEYAIYFTGRDVNNDPEPGFYGYNGTSASSPLWAAFVSLVDEQRAQRFLGNLGFANPAIYAIGENPGPYANDFHDIADGSNNLYYNAVAGYDNSTGWGTINNGVTLLCDLTTTNGSVPGNDNFANAYTISADPSTPETLYGTNVGAGFEGGEPSNTRDSDGASVWWKWTPSESGTATITTEGSDYDSTLGVYTGSSVSALTQVTSNEGVTYAVSFNAVAGTAYSISVDGVELNNANYTPDEGFITLNVSQSISAPVNDEYASAISVFADPENPADVTGSSLGATHQLGEPYNTTRSGGHSVWWTWTPPVSGAATIDTFNSSFDTTLGVYTGSSLSALTQVAFNDDAGGTLQSQVSFSAVGNATYYILVDGYAANQGDINLDISESVPAPGNDNFASAYTVTASPGSPDTVHGENYGATFETNEPSNTRDSDGASVWWKWTPTVTGPATITTSGSNYDDTLGIYTGSSVGSLTQVGSDEGSSATVTFNAVAGTTYSISVDGVELNDPPVYGPAEGDITLTVSQTYPTPSVTSFYPASGAAGTSILVGGSGFTGATVVKFNGTAASFTVDSDSIIQATVPAGATTGPISVSNPSATGSSASSFTVLDPPTVASFSPTSGPVGTSVTITGTNFTGATAVKFNGTTATTFHAVSATSITATVPTGATTGKISVTTPGGTATSSANFTVTTPAPTITGFSPTSGPVGTAVTITGTNFTGTTVVGFQNAHATSFTVNSSTQITTMVPSGAITGPVAVATPSGTAHSSGTFTVTTSSVPTITSFTPTSGPVGTSVTVTGTNFTSATAVKFNGTTATTFHVVSATSVTATVPSGATTGKISVTTPGGTATSSATYTVTTSSVPTITSFSPTSGVIGTNVTITGTNLTGASVVGFTNAHATAFTVVSATEITTFVPYGATTGPLAVLTPGGEAHSSASFTVTSGTPIPHITSFTPASGAAGTAVTITGVGFTGTTVVGFQNAHATSYTVNGTGTQITTKVPTGAVTGPIAVLAPGGEAKSATNFTVP